MEQRKTSKKVVAFVHSLAISLFCRVGLNPTSKTHAEKHTYTPSLFLAYTTSYSFNISLLASCVFVSSEIEFQVVVVVVVLVLVFTLILLPAASHIY